MNTLEMLSTINRQALEASQQQQESMSAWNERVRDLVGKTLAECIDALPDLSNIRWMRVMEGPKVVSIVIADTEVEDPPEVEEGAVLFIELDPSDGAIISHYKPFVRSSVKDWQPVQINKWRRAEDIDEDEVRRVAVEFLVAVLPKSEFFRITDARLVEVRGGLVAETAARLQP